MIANERDRKRRLEFTHTHTQNNIAMISSLSHLDSIKITLLTSQLIYDKYADSNLKGQGYILNHNCNFVSVLRSYIYVGNIDGKVLFTQNTQNISVAILELCYLVLTVVLCHRSNKRPQ